MQAEILLNQFSMFAIRMFKVNLVIMIYSESHHNKTIAMRDEWKRAIFE